MKNILVKLLTFLLTAFIASIIIFRQHYFDIAHTIDLLFVTTFLVLMLIEKEHRYKINSMIILYSIFLCISIASSFWGLDFYRSWFKSMQLILVLINLFFIYNAVKKYCLVNAFFNGILIGSFVNYLIMLGIIQVPFDIYIGMGVHLRAIGTMGNPNTLATTMLISLLVSMLYLFKESNRKDIYYYYQFINISLAMYLIVLTVSKKGILLSMLFLLMYLFLSLRSKKGIQQILALMVLISVFVMYFIDWEAFLLHLEYVKQRFDVFANDLSGTTNTVNTSTEIRKHLVIIGVNAFQDRPLFGYGLDNFRLISQAEYSHNTFIELLVGVGLVGTLIYYSILLVLLKKVHEMAQKELKYFLYFFILCVLLMDLTTVSYGSKLMLFTLLILTVIAEEDRKKGRL